MTKCVILAAGASTRMGAPKALTRLGTETAIERILRSTPVPAIIVTRPGLDLPGAIVNDHPEWGRTGSLQVALRAARDDEVLVWPVDHPLATRETAQLLLSTPGEWVIPTFNGKGGHPFVVRVVDEVLRVPPDTPLRDVPAQRVRVAVDDAGVVANLDTPEDVAREWASGTR